MLKKSIKRLIDIIVSLMGIILLSPIFVLLFFLIKSKLGSPVLFKQERPGMNGKIFTMYKFRSMTDACDEEGVPLPDDVRLTSFGKLLRKTSLDELPELFNIFKGDMSLVGPRPLLVRYLDRYTPEQARRHDVRPGLTGWAQINGRNAISWEEKFELDVWYVDNWSLWLDIKIFFMTFAKVFKSEGISSDTSVTMQEFMGESRDGE